MLLRTRASARRAGFGRVVLVIRRELEASFREALGRRFEARLEVHYAHQELDRVPPGFAVPAERGQGFRVSRDQPRAFTGGRCALPGRVLPILLASRGAMRQAADAMQTGRVFRCAGALGLLGLWGLTDAHAASAPDPARHARPATSPPARARPPAVWVVEGDPENGGFAQHVARAGDVNGDGFGDVLVSHYGHGARPGQLLCYHGSATGLGATPHWRSLAPPERRAHWFGGWAEGVGDVNGDGFGDVLAISHANRDLPAPWVDELYLFHGSPTGLSARPNWRFVSPHAETGVLFTVAPAGDVNGDGCAEVCVAATPASEGAVFRAQVLVFAGARDGLGAQPAARWVFESAERDVRVRAAAAGDVNGDGLGDLIIGDLFWRGPAGGRGRVLVYHGSPAGLPARPDWEVTADRALPGGRAAARVEYLGWSVGAAGDVDGDGFGDVLVGAHNAERDDLKEGMVFLFHGSARGLEPAPRRVIEGNYPYALMGWEVAGAGDVNGDGFADVIVGAPHFASRRSYLGAAFVFHGARRGLAAAPQWSMGTGGGEWVLGKNLGGAGDVNGDDFADVFIGEPGFQRHSQVLGRARVFYGGPDGLADSAGFRLDKTWLASAEQRFERIRPAWKWAAVGALLAGLGGFWLAWRRTLTRLRESERRQALARERERFARDMHDRVGAQLSQIVQWTELAKPEAAATPVGAHLATIAQTARATLESVGDLVWALDPARDSLEHFATHLAQLAERQVQPTPLRLQLDIPVSLPTLKLDSDLREHLAACAAEALRNAVQHAAAQSVTLRLALDDHTLQLTVADDGRGFVPFPESHVPSLPGARRGNGLRNLRVRVSELGGKLEINSRPGAGTTLTFTVPLRRRR